MLLDCRDKSQAATSDTNTIINDTQPVTAIPDDPVQQHTPHTDISSVGEDNVNNLVDGAYSYASDQYSSTEATEEDSGFSDADSYQAWDDDDGEQACELLGDTQTQPSSDEEQDDDKEKVEETARMKKSLAEWVIQCNVPRSHVNNLLRRLKSDCGLNVPIDSRTLLNTMRSKPSLRSVTPGQYAHFGLAKGLLTLMSYHKIHSTITKIRIIIHVDGIPVSKSSGSQFWPILCSIHGYKESKVIIIGIYHGLKKPENVNDFLYDFVCEATQLLQEGLQYDGRVVEVEIAALVCDAPARCMVTSVVSHNGYFSCHKCETKGVWARTVLSAHGGRVAYPEVNAPLRNDASFRARSQPGHHNQKKERSIIEKLPIDLVKAVPIDYMHNVCIGVQKKLLRIWLFGKMDPTRLTTDQKKLVSDFLVFIKEYCPVEFPRKTRTLDDFPHFKATEHRNHLLYFLPVALKGVLSQKMYDHYMLFHVAIKILTNSKHCQTYATYAQNLLKRFVEDCVSIYGVKFISYNVHNLIHLPADVQELGSLDSYSAFPFENKLQTIKNLMRTSANPLAQVIRRLKEIEEINTTNDYASPSSTETLSYSCEHTNGPTPINFKGYQYKKIQLRNVTICTKRPDNCVFLNDGSVALVKNILKSTDGKISLYVKKYLQKEDLYTNPLISSTFAELVVSDLSTKLTKINVDYVVRKAIRFPMSQPKNGKYFVSPLFMS